MPTRNVRMVTGGYMPEDRVQALADALTARALRSRAPDPVGRGQVQPKMSPWEGLSQMGEALVGAMLASKGMKYSQEQRDKASEANENLIRQLSGEQGPRRIEDRAPMKNFGQPTGEPIQAPLDLETGRPMLLSDKSQALAAAIAGTDPREANKVLGGMVISKMFPGPEEAYTLKPGETRYQGGKVVASIPEKKDAPKMTDGYWFNEATGQWEQVPGYLEGRERIARAGKSETNIDTGLKLPKPPAGYYYPDPTVPEIAPLPGGPVASEAAAEQQRAADKAASAAVDAERGLVMIETAKGKVGFTSTGFIGQVLGKIGGRKAYDLRSAIKPLQSGMAFDRLQRMREESKTGGALGNVSERELDLLMSTIASLDPNQSEEQLLQMFGLVEQQYKRAMFAYNAMVQEMRQGGGRQGLPNNVGTPGVSPEDRANSYYTSGGN